MRLVEADREIKAVSVNELKITQIIIIITSLVPKRDRRTSMVAMLARIVIVNTAARLNRRHSIGRITKINMQTFSKVTAIIITIITRRKLIV